MQNILVEIRQELRLLNEREYLALSESSTPFKLIGNVNRQMIKSRFSFEQETTLIFSIAKNINYLAHKSPEKFMSNFKQTVLKDLKNV